MKAMGILTFTFGLAAIGYGLYTLDQPIITVIVGILVFIGGTALVPDK